MRRNTETRVLELAACGLSNPEIAERLGCAPGTVGSHWRGIRNKSGCRSQRAVLAMLIDP